MTLIVRFWNIFAISHLMHIISIVMDSEHYVDNFQPVFVAKTAKFHRKKKRWKNFRFLKNQFLWYNIYISVLPTLRGVRKYIFHPCFLTWQDTRVQNVLVADEISVSLKNAELLRNIITLFSMILFIIWTSICLSLFIYTSCHDYNGLITSFLYRGH